MSNDDLVLGLTVFLVVLMLIEGLRISLAMLDDAMPPSVRLRERLRDAGPSGRQPGGSIVKQGRLADARLLRQWLSRFAFAGAVEKLLAQAGMRIKVAPFLLLTLGLAGLPSLLALHRRRRRLARMEAQLPDALDLLCGALRAGHALPSALRLVADDAGRRWQTSFASWSMRWDTAPLWPTRCAAWRCVIPAATSAASWWRC